MGRRVHDLPLRLSRRWLPLRFDFDSTAVRNRIESLSNGGRTVVKWKSNGVESKLIRSWKRSCNQVLMSAGKYYRMQTIISCQSAPYRLAKETPSACRHLILTD